MTTPTPGGLCPRCERPRPACLCGEGDRLRAQVDAMRVKLAVELAAAEAHSVPLAAASTAPDADTELGQALGYAEGLRRALEVMGGPTPRPRYVPTAAEIAERAAHNVDTTYPHGQAVDARPGHVLHESGEPTPTGECERCGLTNVAADEPCAGTVRP